MRACSVCGEPLQGRADKRYCSGACRVAAHRGTVPRRVTARSASPVTANAEPTYIKQRMIGIHETDRCECCARPWGGDVWVATTHYGGSTQSVVRTREPALCFDCKNGVVDPIGLLTGGEIAINRMEPIPCGICSGELSEIGLQRIYIDGATLPQCDACSEARDEEQVARDLEMSVPAVRRLIATLGGPR